MSGRERRTSHRMRTAAVTSGQQRTKIMALRWHKVGSGRFAHLSGNLQSIGIPRHEARERGA
jgi:hypothetical protein